MNNKLVLMGLAYFAGVTAAIVYNKKNPKEISKEISEIKEKKGNSFQVFAQNFVEIHKALLEDVKIKHLSEETREFLDKKEEEITEKIDAYKNKAKEIFEEYKDAGEDVKEEGKEKIDSLYAEASKHLEKLRVKAPKKIDEIQDTLNDFLNDFKKRLKK